MRRVFYTFVFVLAVSAAFAQAPNKAPKGMKYTQRMTEKMMKNEVQPLQGKVEVEVNEWFRFLDDWSALMGGFRSQNSFFSLFPDTTVVNMFFDDETNSADPQYHSWCGLGQVFDPKDDAWSNPDLPGLRDWYGYTVDSIFFTYGYFRYGEPTVDDTLIVQVYKESQLTNGSFTSTGSVFAVASYDQDAGIGANYTEIHRIPINAEDSNQLSSEGTFQPKLFSMAIGGEDGIQVDPGERLAYSVTYKPGVEYSKDAQNPDTLFFADELVDFGIAPPKKRINRFGILVAVQTPTYTPLNSYNNGMFIVSWNRYDEPFEGGGSFLNNKYYPNSFGNGTESFGYYPYLAFKVNANYNTGIEDAELQNGYALGQAYPNPATTQDEISLSFAIQDEERVQINILDLTGKVVKTITDANYAQGEHKIQFNANNLKPGVYIYRMTAGSYTQSSKFNVVR